MSNGYMGLVPWVDLSTGRIENEILSGEIQRDFMGGYGIGARLIYERQVPGIDPLGPDNTLGFFAGPLTGTNAIIASRFTVMGKSPLTGGWGDANCGGYFGPHMKFAGVDGIFLTGTADRPVYLYIENGQGEIRDAAHLWGKNSAQTEEMLMVELGKDIAVACIGPAGEKTSLISAVINDKGRAAGRSGVGAIMGSKNLKAIVVRGKQKVPVADEALLAEFRRKYLDDLHSSPGFGRMSDYGTSASTASAISSGDGPLKNWGGTYPKDFPNEESISGDNVLKYQIKKYGCWHCPIACGGWARIESGPYIMEGHKPEYETLEAFGGLCGNDNVESIFRANDICNMAGLDTISAGAVIAFAIECYENGILNKADTDGLELRWGNHNAILQMLEKTARREGLGDLLADGVKVAAAKIGRGAEQFAMHVGGQELPMHDGKVFPGLALTYQYDATPARHTQACEDWAAPGLPVGKYEMDDYSGRGEDHYKQATFMHIVNCAGLCQFGNYNYNVQGLPDFLRAVTGWDYTLDDVFRDGERIHTLRHLFNLREGINPRLIAVPGRLLGHPAPVDGPTQGISVDMEEMVRDFYRVMDYDLESSVPSNERLEALGLDGLLERESV